MAFNVTAAPTAVAGLEGALGVESITIRWDQHEHPIQIWRHTSDNFPAATLVMTTTGNTITDSFLTAGQEYVYWVRPVRTLSTGEIHYGPSLTVIGTPLFGEIGEATVETIHVAADAITGRSTFTETTSQYVSNGTNSVGGTTTAGDETWTLPDIAFVGDGNTQVITTICRQSETPVYFRMGNSTVWAKVKAEIIDVTGGGTVLDSQELTVAGVRVEQQGVGPSAWLSFPHFRDFHHNFILATTAARNYAIRFTLTCGCDDFSNFIHWASNYRQVLWQIYKR